MDLVDLHKPFPPAEIEWRVGSTNGEKTKGLALAYLTARHVMERLDEVCGPSNWQDRYEFHGSRTVCYLSIRVDGEWITKADGAGDSDVEAEKGAISDALKRAAVKWGIGRYLYDLGNTWVAIEGAGKSYRIQSAEYPRLAKVLADKFGSSPQSPPSNQNSRLPEEASAKLHDQIDFELGLAGENLAAIWKKHWGTIQTLYFPHQEALTRKKDALKAALSEAA